jgi:hypothetical protein
MLSNPGQHSDYVWLVAVPAKNEFTQPQFHFGECVKWTSESSPNRCWLTGRIRGMWFSDSHKWEYLIALDSSSVGKTELEASAILNESELKLVEGASMIRKYLKPASEWQPTEQAAVALGLSSDQLRNLRLKGLFSEGQHYRDTSVPGSARPYWQWNIEQCSTLLNHR